MKSLYNIGIWGYYFLLRIVSIRNEKARKWLLGRKDLFRNIADTIQPGDRILWFHVSSLGEFEQGRPVIELIRKDHPEFKILLTFFSPSGYEIQKSYPFADYVFYIPLDTRQNASRFIDLVKPEKVFFVKYEFWYHFLIQLNERNIPTYIFSALFRPSQIFFRWYGKWYLKAISTYKYLFVQNQESYDLLVRNGITNVAIAGDTRLDRVAEIADHAPRLEKVERFCGSQKALVAGSTWKEDEDLFIAYLNKFGEGQKFIIAPHEVNPASIERITRKLQRSYTFYSTASNEDLESSQVLIVDGYGYLVSVYRYGFIAYVGGGFTSGIHSILEPAAYGLPVIFGPDYDKFQEAHDLLQDGGAFTIETEDEFNSILDQLLTDDQLLETASEASRNYVNKNRGASSFVVSHLFPR